MQKFLDWCDSREGQIAAVRLILVLALIGLGIVLGRMFPSHKKADPDIVKISSEVEGLKIYAIKASETSAHIIISGPGGVVTKTIGLQANYETGPNVGWVVFQSFEEFDGYVALVESEFVSHCFSLSLCGCVRPFWSSGRIRHPTRHVCRGCF